MNSNNLDVIVFVLLLPTIVLARRSRGITAHADLPRGQRMRLLALELLEPPMLIVVVGLILWSDLGDNSWHVVAAVIGAIVGIPIGIYRSRIMWVRAVPEQHAVVLKRSWIEVVLLLVLIALKLVTEISASPTSWLSVVITGLLALDLAESMARVAAVALRYRRESATAPRSVQPVTG